MSKIQSQRGNYLIIVPGKGFKKVGQLYTESSKKIEAFEKIIEKAINLSSEKRCPILFSGKSSSFMEEYALFKIHFDRGYKPDIYIENRSENTVLNAYYSKKKVMKLIKKEILNKNLTIFLVATRDHLYKKKGKDIFDKYFTSDGIIPVPTNISEKPISKEDKLIRYCYNNILPTVLKRKTTWLMTFTYKRLENIRMFYRIYKKIKILFK